MNGLAQRLIESLPDRPRLLFAEPRDETALVRFAARIGRAQRWMVADPDPARVDAVFEQLAQWARARGLTTTWPARALLIHAPGGAWRIEGVAVDPAELMEPEFADAVIVDLSGAEDSVWHAYQAPQDRPPLLACRCATGHTSWRPRLPADVLLRPLFRAAINPDALLTSLRHHGCAVAAAVTDLRIPAGALAALRSLVNDVANQARSLRPAHRGAIEAWRAARLRQTLSSRVSVTIGYRDILAFPPNSDRE